VSYDISLGNNSDLTDSNRGIIGPILVHNGIAFGVLSEPEDPKWHDLTSFASLGKKWTTIDTPSPRYWLLWPGVLAMIAISFTDLLLQYKTFWVAFKAVGRAIKNARGKKNTNPNIIAGQEEKEASEKDGLVQDPADPSELPNPYIWMTGLLLSVIGMCLVMGKLFNMPVGMSLLSVFLAFFFSFLAIQCTGVTGKMP
jgi:OPT oligopeptide transporter protein